MKSLGYLCLFLFTISGAHALHSDAKPVSKRNRYKFPKSNEYLEYQRKNQQRLKTQNAHRDLAKAKFELINGHTQLAKGMIMDFEHVDQKSLAIQKRYLALIAFLDENYSQSLDYLESVEFSQTDNYKHICTLKILNLLILDKKDKAAVEWPRCRLLTSTDSETSTLWMQTLVNLKTLDPEVSTAAPFKKLAIENEDKRFLKLFLKLALYLNKSDFIVKEIPKLGPEAYEDDEIRELLGMIYYRNGQLVKAYSFLEDLTTPNAEAIKGNLYLAQKKYEMSYAQFKLVLKQKSNSENALERLIPLAWILRQWEEGSQFAKAIPLDYGRQDERKLMMASFLLMDNKLEESKVLLKSLLAKKDYYQGSVINSLYSFILLQQKKTQETKEYAAQACKQLEATSCWLMYQLNLWDDFALTLGREEKIEIPGLLIEKFTTQVVESPIDEDNYINQKDIDELDDELISLLPEKISFAN